MPIKTENANSKYIVNTYYLKIFTKGEEESEFYNVELLPKQQQKVSRDSNIKLCLDTATRCSRK